jgi:myo-inositol-1(or 4)-monophosphatase
VNNAEAIELAEIARMVAGESGIIAMKAFARREESVIHKGAVDLVTQTDLAVEEHITRRLRELTDFAVLGEEGGLTGSTDGATWVVDPIDGTTNFSHRVPHFAVSIGLWSESHALLGTVLSPVPNECFWCDGSASYLDDDRLPTLQPPELANALLASGFPYDRQTSADNNTGLWGAFMKECQGLRRFGAAALDLAWVAAGRIDGFWEPRLKPWDFAAGAAIVRCAGGRVTDYTDNPLTLSSESLVAAGPGLHAEMLKLIAAHYAPC